MDSDMYSSFRDYARLFYPQSDTLNLDGEFTAKHLRERGFEIWTQSIRGPTKEDPNGYLIASKGGLHFKLHPKDSTHMDYLVSNVKLNGKSSEELETIIKQAEESFTMQEFKVIGPWVPGVFEKPLVDTKQQLKEQRNSAMNSLLGLTAINVVAGTMPFLASYYYNQNPAQASFYSLPALFTSFMFTTGKMIAEGTRYLSAVEKLKKF